jgi:hypothetical protein
VSIVENIVRSKEKSKVKDIAKCIVISIVDIININKKV